MAAESTKSGGEYLAKKSRINRKRAAMAPLLDVLIVDDDALDADRMLGTLRVMCGYDATLRRAASIDVALKLVMAKQPDIIFLDDILKPSDDAVQTIPFLRRTGFRGPIVVISGQVTRKRKPMLLEAGTTDVIHKDDVDSVRLAEAIQKAFATTSRT
ncbi:MAG: response regulator [Hyphomicrobium sp.]